MLNRCVLPAGYAGSVVSTDELLLYCPDKESPCRLYLRQGASWWEYPTQVEYSDLASYNEYYHRNPYWDLH